MRTVYGVVVHPVREDDRDVAPRWFEECWLNARSKPLFLLRLFAALGVAAGLTLVFAFWLTMLEAAGVAGWCLLGYQWIVRRSRPPCLCCNAGSGCRRGGDHSKECACRVCGTHAPQLAAARTVD